MSGGSLDHVYARVNDASLEISSRSNKPIHRAFAAHLWKVAEALHDIEWVMSGDYAEGRDHEAIKAVISSASILDASISLAEKALADLNEALAEAKRVAAKEGGSDA